MTFKLFNYIFTQLKLWIVSPTCPKTSIEWKLCSFILFEVKMYPIKGENLSYSRWKFIILEVKMYHIRGQYLTRDIMFLQQVLVVVLEVLLFVLQVLAALLKADIAYGIENWDSLWLQTDLCDELSSSSYHKEQTITNYHKLSQTIFIIFCAILFGLRFAWKRMGSIREGLTHYPSQRVERL